MSRDSGGSDGGAGGGGKAEGGGGICDKLKAGERSSGPGWKRYIVAWSSCLGLLLVLAMRSEMGIAINKMTKKVPEQVEMSAHNRSYYRTQQVQEVAWDHLDVGVIEASFFFGYALFSIPAGYIASYLPANILLGCAVLTTCVLNTLVPSAAHLEPPSTALGAAMTVRALQGMAEGCLYPSVHGIWRYWAPAQERSKLATISFFGLAMGAIVGLPLCGAVTTKLGWPINFYLFGALGCAWAVAWLLFVYHKPSSDPYISQEEVEYIEQNSSPATTTGQLPCRAIITSLPVWAIVLANVGRNWTYQFSHIGLPAYFSHVFGLSSENVGICMMVPFILMAILTPIGGILADCLRCRFLSTTATRRLFNTTGFGVMAMCYVVVGASRNLYLSCAFLTIGMGFMGLGMSGYAVNHLDIAPRFAGFLMGLSNGIGTVSGVLSPIIASAITKNGTFEEWQIVFMIAFGVHTFTVSFYLFFSSGDLQPWAEDGESGSLLDTSKPATSASSGGGVGAADEGAAMKPAS